MTATPEELFARLDALGIAHETHRHQPIFTVEDGHEAWKGIPGVHCKNLFLKDAKKALWLVVAPIDRQVDLKRLPARIGSARLSFGRGELLREVLGVEPGSVTPFALVNDRDCRVRVVLDQWMTEQPLVNYHPLRNDMTTTVSAGGLLTFIRACGHRWQAVDLR